MVLVREVKLKQSCRIPSNPGEGSQSKVALSLGKVPPRRAKCDLQGTAGTCIVDGERTSWSFVYEY